MEHHDGKSKCLYCSILIQVSSINRILKKIQHDWHTGKHMHEGNHIYKYFYFIFFL